MANGQTNISGGKTLVGTAQPSDVRMGMTYPDGKELRSGTLDLANLTPENIKSGVTISGVVGELTPLLEMNIISGTSSLYHKFLRTGNAYLLLRTSGGGHLFTGYGEIAYGGSGINIFRKFTVNKDDIIQITNPDGCATHHSQYEHLMRDTPNCKVILNSNTIIEIQGAKRGKYSGKLINGESARLIKDDGLPIHNSSLSYLLPSVNSLGLREGFYNDAYGNHSKIIPTPISGLIILLY